ncbi:TPA: alpha/beta hydrolase family protein [Vibrio parahaemolyticus]
MIHQKTFNYVKRIALISLFISCNSYALEKDITYSIDAQNVVGTLTLPDSKNPPPVVLMLHGFNGNRDELPVKGTDEGLYSRTARVLANHGIASLRIDFRGSGESDGNWEDTTFSSQIEDARAAIEWLRDSHDIDKSRIGVLGWSQGGLVASHVVSSNKDVKSTVLWAPVTHPVMTYSSLLGSDNVLKASRSEDTEVFVSVTNWGDEIKLKAPFFKEVFSYNPIGAITNYRGPLLVIIGSKDDLVVDVNSWMKYHEGDEKLVELSTNHVWDIFSSSDVLDKKLLPETISWFEKM